MKINCTRTQATHEVVSGIGITLLVLMVLDVRLHAALKSIVQPKNVLLLIADDLNSWLLGDPNRYAGKVIAPNLRKLAATGINFTHAYTASPVCSPSRTAFLSGVAPYRSGLYHNALEVKESKPLQHALSLAGAFKAKGYSTAGFGKITHGWDQKQHWDLKIGHKRDPAPPGAPLTLIGRGEQDWGPIHLAEEDMNDSKNASKAISQLRKEHKRPFFIAYGTFNPHMPWYVPQKYFDLFPEKELHLPPLMANDLDDVPPLGRALTAGKSKFVDAVFKAGLHKDAVRAYLATTAYADAQFGRVLQALEESPHRDNTIVVFLSDHGFHLGEKRHWQKATLWEEATHCLLTIRVPGSSKIGKVSQRFVSLQDLYPTLADLCELELPNHVDGRSLVPLLKNPKAKWKSTAITGLSNKSEGKEAYLTLRNASGRYIRYQEGQEEFYHTKKDPNEWKNQILNPEYRESVSALRKIITDIPEIATPLKPVRRKQK